MNALRFPTHPSNSIPVTSQTKFSGKQTIGQVAEIVGTAVPGAISPFLFMSHQVAFGIASIATFAILTVGKLLRLEKDDHSFLFSKDKD